VPEYQDLIYKQDGYVAEVVLNRPEKKNAISRRMFGELQDVLARTAEDIDVRCLVFSGAGGAFCSGADLTDGDNAVSSPFEMRERMDYLGDIARTLIDSPTPTIAKVTGIAAGAGCSLAFCCDMIVASREAKFCQIFVRRGLVLDFGSTWALPRLLPINKAKELALLGDVITAEDADRLGLVNRLCEASDVDDVAADLAARLAAQPPRTVALIKENLNRSHARTIQETLDSEADAQALALTTEDTLESVRAFIEKREPRYTGR
jgi:enoyl-CoA hydratase/carnithine racemase